MPKLTHHGAVCSTKYSTARARWWPTLLTLRMFTCNYYSYWSGVQHDGVELYPREGRTIVVDKTNDCLSMICIVFPKAEFDRIRSNVEGEYLLFEVTRLRLGAFSGRSQAPFR